MAREEAKPRSRATREAATQVEEVDESIQESITVSESEALIKRSNVESNKEQFQVATIHVRFFDEATLHPIEIPAGAQLEFRQQNTRGEWSAVVIDKVKEGYAITLPRSSSGGDLFEMQLPPFEEKCVRHISRPVVFRASSSNANCGVIPVPVYRLEESCTLKVHVHDGSCREDDDRRLLDGVEVKIVPMKTQAHASDAAEKHARESYSGKTTRGVFAIDVPCRQLYQVEVQSPKGYICKTPVQNYYVCCERSMELKVSLGPCERTQSHLLLLVDSCGNPLPNQQIYLDGRPQTSGSDGQIVLRSSVAGRVHLQYPEKQFQPEYLEMTGNEPLFSVIKMSDQPVRAQSQEKQRYQFVSEHGHAFAKRKVILESSNGEKTVEWTDSNGYFSAMASSTMFAEDDDQGLAIGPMLLLSTGE